MKNVDTTSKLSLQKKNCDPFFIGCGEHQAAANLARNLDVDYLGCR
jgi:hypothetical protein